MAETRTKSADESADAFIDAVEKPQRREDARAARALLERVSGFPARMWGPSIIGFGSYRYRYESGREGEMCRVGFSPRAANLVFYVGGLEDQEPALGRLGKHKRGKACLYVGKLSDIDSAVLEQIVRAALARNDDAPG